VRLRLAAGDGPSRIARAVPAGADHQASQKVNKLGTCSNDCVASDGVDVEGDSRLDSAVL